MSKNIIPTVGQHVFKYDPPRYTEKGVPVLAENTDEHKGINDGRKDKFQFLGEGYYFWDSNRNRAHKWGKDHYKGDYLILELDLVLSGENFLDLAGSRHDLLEFYKVYSGMRKGNPNLKIGAFFKTMQILQKHRPEKWPFTVVRALNVKKGANRIPFNHVSDSEMILDPEIIICFYDRNELNLQNIRYIDKNGNIWTPTKF